MERNKRDPPTVDEKFIEAFVFVLKHDKKLDQAIRKAVKKKFDEEQRLANRALAGLPEIIRAKKRREFARKEMQARLTREERRKARIKALKAGGRSCV